MDLIDWAKSNGLEVMAWAADEPCGRDGAFLDGLDERGEAFAVEISPNAYVWLSKAKALEKSPETARVAPGNTHACDAARSSTAGFGIL